MKYSAAFLLLSALYYAQGLAFSPSSTRPRTGSTHALTLINDVYRSSPLQPKQQRRRASATKIYSVAVAAVDSPDTKIKYGPGEYICQLSLVDK